MKRQQDEYSATVERGNRNSQPDKLPMKPLNPMNKSKRPKPNPRMEAAQMTSSPRPKANPRMNKGK